jgi:phage-related protein
MKIVNASNNTEQHRLECEARHMLTLPLAERRKELIEIEKFRGIKAVEYLKNEILIQHKLKKTND